MPNVNKKSSNVVHFALDRWPNLYVWPDSGPDQSYAEDLY